MKFIIKKGTKVFKALNEVKKKMKIARDAAHDLVGSIPKASTQYYGAINKIAGGVSAFIFEDRNNVPAGWRKVEHYGWFPKATEKSNKELLKKIKELPTVDYDVLNSAVGFEQHFAGVKFLKCIGINWGRDFHLVEMDEDAKYKPLPGMKEITVTEYNKLSKKRK